MYRFYVRAFTQPGETIALVGSLPAVGQWDTSRCLRLQTSPDRYPLWWVDLELDGSGLETADPAPDRRMEYKYVRIGVEGQITWETMGANRWMPLEASPLPSPIIVEDGWWNVLPSSPYGYFAEPVAAPPVDRHPDGLKIVVIGSSVALGCSAWLLRGWAWHLGQALQAQYGHHLVNVSEVGANVGTTIARFPQVVTPEKPDVVIIALSLGNEGLAASPPAQYRAIQRRFENGLQQLIKMVRECGAQPMLGGVYPNGDYSPGHYAILRDTQQRLLSWGVPVLDWLAAVDDGQGRWQPGLSFDAAHPNTLGHRRMYEALDLSLFKLTRSGLRNTVIHPTEAKLIYQDDWGFQVGLNRSENSLRIINATPYPYTIAPSWHALQTAMQTAQVVAGLYLLEAPIAGTSPFLLVQEDGQIGTTLTIPAATHLMFYPAFHFFMPQYSKILFYDGHLGILKLSDRRLYVINTSDHAYNIQPMWQEVRVALQTMPPGVYEDPVYPDLPFRTLMVGPEGLESRVKLPAQSALFLDYQCTLTERGRVAIVPLGDRCAVRMLLYKLEYDGPAFPFDLTRTTNLADVADIIQSDFHDMWNPHYLSYNHDARRIYHTKWSGLSFAHEVEDSDDPVNNMFPVYERMKRRYTARSQRFWYTLNNCDKILFVRTGICDRGAVIDLMHKLEAKCQGKPFRLLIISPQASHEFNGLPNVLHYNQEFNPDRMYEDLGHWLHCTEVMRHILNSLGISSKNLFWCPPTPPRNVSS
ncbi:DUF1796 family putative cysteine peptidase [Trichothermofontia sp.]